MNEQLREKKLSRDEKDKMKEESKYEFVNHPKHYNRYSRETIMMMVNIWGFERAIDWCEMTAFKYRMRAGTKPGQSIEEDLAKEEWYLQTKQDLVQEAEKYYKSIQELQEYPIPDAKGDEETDEDNRFCKTEVPIV